MNYNKLHNYLEINKITFTELSKKIGVHRSTLYNNFEKRNMTVETLEQICNAINVPIHDFFNEIEPGTVSEPGIKYQVKNLDYKKAFDVCQIEKKALENQIIELKKLLLK